MEIKICYFKRDFHHVVFKNVFTNMCFISKLDNTYELCYIEKGNVIKIKSLNIADLIEKGKDFCKSYFDSKIKFKELKTNED